MLFSAATLSRSGTGKHGFADGGMPDNLMEHQGELVTPSDSTDLPSGVCIGLYISGSGGNINVNLNGGGTAVLTSLSAGQFVQVAATRVLSTSTTATNVYAIYRSL
jgi:hypothetical protein